MGKYWKWYWGIIEKSKYRDAQSLGYFEKHHVIPKSLGGDDGEDNIVALTAKEHFICHHILTKITKDEDQVKMWNAFFFMHMNPSTKSSRYFTARTFELSKLKMSETKKNLVGEMNPFYGKRHNETAKEKMSKNWNRGLRQHKRNIYTFEHTDGRTFTGIRHDFCKCYNMNHKDVYKIVNGKQQTTKGWRICNG